MKLINEIPDRFWSLFRSVNRPVYTEALLKINEEYEYSNYFLSRETCIRLLNEYFASKPCILWKEEEEEETQDPPATRVLNWLLKAGWLRRVEDYAEMTSHIVIPDYAAVMIEAFLRLTTEEEDQTQIYIQNVYAILFSLKNDPRSGPGLLDTALVNTRRLNKSLQDMLHNMDRFFGSLLEKKDYASLLKEHLDGYVTEIVNRKYHLLKTSDNFYIYKTDIKTWIRDMREDHVWLEELCRRRGASEDPAAVLEKLDLLERGFDHIERRIANMDREHSRYVKATVTRLEYLLSQEDDTKGLMIQLLNRLSRTEENEEQIEQIAERMNLLEPELLSRNSLYRPKRPRTDFAKEVEDQELTKELPAKEVLSLNRVKNRYSQKEIEDFLKNLETEGRIQVEESTAVDREAFEKLILAYDQATRKQSLYQVEDETVRQIHNGAYSYPGLVFVRRKPGDGGISD